MSIQLKKRPNLTPSQGNYTVVLFTQTEKQQFKNIIK